MNRSGQSLNEVPNQAILKGLANEGVEPEEEPFVVESRPMGLRTGIDRSRINALVDDLEADAFLALTTRLVSRTDSE